MQVRSSEVPIADLEPSEVFATSLEVWEALRGDRAGPRWSIDNQLRFPTRMLPFMTVVDVRRSPEDFVYRYWGSGHAKVMGYDLTGKSVREHVPAELAELFFGELQTVLLQGRPLGFRRDHPEAAEAGPVWQDVLRLPLSEDGAAVTQILSIADWADRGKQWGSLFSVRID